MGVMIVSLAHKYDITAIATLGETGYCGHFDHIATHEAALEAQAVLAGTGREIPILALQTDGTGELVAPVDRKQKLAALALHISQGGFGAEFWSRHTHYAPLLEQETYNVSHTRQHD